MAKQLSPEDRRAVDLVLDRESMGSSAFYAAVNNGMGKRMQAVENLLHKLDALPAQDPAPNLTARVMERIAETEAESHAMPTHAMPPHLRPHA